jgi:imidazole glycerol phosphate synthase subunit HisF
MLFFNINRKLSPNFKVLEMSSEKVFVPFTVGGGIREYTDETGHCISLLIVLFHIRNL